MATFIIRKSDFQEVEVPDGPTADLEAAEYADEEGEWAWGELVVYPKENYVHRLFKRDGKKGSRFVGSVTIDYPDPQTAIDSFRTDGLLDQGDVEYIDYLIVIEREDQEGFVKAV